MLCSFLHPHFEAQISGFLPNPPIFILPLFQRKTVIQKSKLQTINIKVQINKTTEPKTYIYNTYIHIYIFIYTYIQLICWFVGDILFVRDMEARSWPRGEEHVPLSRWPRTPPVDGGDRWRCQWDPTGRTVISLCLQVCRQNPS